MMRPKESPQIGLLDKRVAAFTLAEVTMCVAVTLMIFTGILAGFVQSARNADRSIHSLAVLGLDVSRPEQTRADKRETPAPSVVPDAVMQPPSMALAEAPISGAE